MLHEIVLKNLQQEGLLVDQRRVHLILAYSGGMDSTVLLHVLAKLRESQNLKVTAAYFNHGWREEADHRFAEELPLIHAHCKKLNIPLVIAPANKNTSHTETAAREARYYALTHLTQDLKAQALITAHQADDQIETMLFRLFRGTGIDGLIGIQKKLILHPDVAAPIPILRPMLDTKRGDVKHYAKTNDVSYFEDPSNSNRRHQRNMIRNEVVPFIEERFPNVKDTLYRLSHVADGDLTILNEKIDEIWARVYEDGALNTILFNQLGHPYQRRVIKRYLHHHQLECDFNRIEDIIDFIEGENRKNLGSALMSLNKDQFLSIYKNQITVLSKKADTEKESDSLKNEPAVKSTLSIPGKVSSETLGVSLEIRELSQKEKSAPDLLSSQEGKEVYVDLSDYKDCKLELRSRQPGDKIHPFGMATPMRLKNYFINRGVPRFERDKIPILSDGQNILWVAEVGISETLRVEGQPTHVLKITQLERQEVSSDASSESASLSPSS